MNTSAFWFESADGVYEIENSLRFRGAQYLRRTLPSGTLNSVQTYSAWVKLGSFDTSTIMARYIVSGTSEISLGYTSEGFAYNRGDTGEDTNPSLHKHRDPAAWYHVFSVCNGTNYQTWINGEVLGGYNGNVNGVLLVPDRTLTIGRRDSTNVGYLNGYLAEVHAIDGQLINISEFGEYNADGVWVPKKVEGINYGTNGFYLDFSDPANIGADRSGNGNDFTATGFELTNTASISYDWMEDSPTNNHSTWNPLSNSTLTSYVDANLVGQRLTGTTFGASGSSIEVPDNAKTYVEVEVGSVVGGLVSNYAGVGSYEYNRNNSNQNGVSAAGWATYFETGEIYVDGALLRTESALPANGVIGMAIDRTVTPNTVQFSVDGVNKGAAVSLSTPIRYVFGYTREVSSVFGNVIIRTGSLPFRYGPPAGFSELSTENLSAVAIKNPSDDFTTILDTGANILTAAQATISNGLWWIKDRANANEHQLLDSVRGGNLALQCPAAGSETAYSAPAGNSVAWCWKTDATFTNPAGTGGASVASSGATNKTAGFSIVSWTADAGDLNGQLLSGLDQKPEFMIYKDRTATHPFIVNYTLDGGASYSSMQLNNTGAASAMPGTQIPNSDTTISAIGYTGGRDVVTYCWHSVPGYSAFGSYVGNGNADGPFCFTGHRPAFLLLRNSNSTTLHDWVIYDVERSIFNPVNTRLMPNSADPENNTGGAVDILSNGFKVRNSTQALNESGRTIIWASFAEMPFGGGNVSPAPAR